MTVRFSLLLLATALAGCGTAPSPLHNNRSDFTRRTIDEMPVLPAVDATALRAEHGAVPLVVMNDERTIEHQFAFNAGVWDYVLDVRRQYVVLDPAEARATTFRIDTDRRDVLEGVRLRVLSPDGAERLFSATDLIREATPEGTVYRLAYPDVREGTVVEESFRTRRSWDRTFEPPLYHDVRLQYDVPVEHLTFRYIYPSAWALALKKTGAQSMPDFQVDRDSHPRHTILTARRDHVPAFADEPFSPFFKEVGPYLEFAVTKIYAGDLLPLYAAPETWEALAARFGRYVFSRRGGTSGPVAQQARAIADPAQPDSLRLAAVVGWVQNTITPTDGEPGDGALDLAETLRTRRANDLLITGLTQAMLEETGFEADFVLLHPASEGFFDPAFVDARQFTAPAVLVRLEGADRVVFPYLAGVPVTYVPEQYQSAIAMRVGADGLGGFVRLPAGDASQSTTEETVDVQITPDGVVEVQETATLRGAAGVGMRTLLRDLTPDEREARLRSFVAYDEGETRDFSYTVEGESNPESDVVVTLRYAIDDLVTVTPEEVLFQTGGLLSPASLSTVERAGASRRNPIHIYRTSTTDKTIRIRYPEAWALTTPLEDAGDQTQFGRAVARYALAPGLVTATQRIQLRPGTGEASDADALLRLIGASSRLSVPTLVFSVGE